MTSPHPDIVGAFGETVQTSADARIGGMRYHPRATPTIRRRAHRRALRRRREFVLSQALERWAGRGGGGRAGGRGGTTGGGGRGAHASIRERGVNSAPIPLPIGRRHPGKGSTNFSLFWRSRK